MNIISITQKIGLKFFYREGETMIINLLIISIISFLLIFSSYRLYPEFLTQSIVISALSGLLLFFYQKWQKLINGQKFFAALLGILLGYFISTFLLSIFNPLVIRLHPVLLPYFKIAFQMLIIYLIALKSYHTGFSQTFIAIDDKEKSDKKGENKENYKILDTSVIIDGRISDISDTGFLEGILIIPRFVLNELQQIADSADSLKRQRGRRGLDILSKMKKGIKAVVQIVDDDFPDVKEVDEKLIHLGKKLNGAVVTNDFNLNKVAQLQGVKVLNINELSNAVKPIVLPGEELSILVAKEGKDSDQGIGYLEDGTMIVVEKGRQYIGKKVDVVVTSVLQTTAGRMIFAK